MANAQTAAKTAKDITLDTSFDHPALTPEMRRMAAKLWEIVQAKAVEEDFPLRDAWLYAETDVEGVAWVHVVVRCNTSSDEAFAFEDGLEPDFSRWIKQLPEERRGFEDHPHLYLGWIPAARLNDGV